MAMAGGPADPDPGAGCLSNAFVARMRITLDDVSPTVTRLIEVPLGIRLDRLHAVFQVVLAWTDSHLSELTFGRTGFGIPDPAYGFDGPLDARKATLAEALEGMRGKTFRYLYDFGDGWNTVSRSRASHRLSHRSATPACLRLKASVRLKTRVDLGATPKHWKLCLTRPTNIMSRRSKSSAMTMIRTPSRISI